MDGSLREDAKTPAGYDYNIEVTRRVLTQEMMLTDPSQARDFVTRTGVDALAMAKRYH